MKMKKLIYGALTLGAVALLAFSAPALAHHAFGAEFDPDAPSTDGMVGLIVLVR